ncbi:MAG: hypothetical protein A2054_08115 [Deltaproteobacteria bacterium GWA2_55_10]|nr:MAG: hypothetical protein A2054_08115 [Deltaproteobacteria bacterium GWA2_55_10]
MQNSVTFWTEGGPSVGMGHVMRCINIAHALDEQELLLHFLVNNERPVIDRLNSEAIFHITYPITGRHPSRLAGDVVIIDTKKDVSSQVHTLKDDGRKVILIDNTSTDEADAVIMPTPIYKGAPKGGLIAGSEYIIIGERFRNAREREMPGFSLPLKVLVTMGGSDPNNLTGVILKELKDIDGIEVTAVIGPAFSTKSTFENLKSGWDKCSFVHNPQDMASLMKNSHVAFTAMGTTIFELAYMGVPSIVIGNYESDREDLASIQDLGISKGLGFHRDIPPGQICAAITAFRDDAALWQETAMKARALTDGRGALRIANLITSMLCSEKTARVV